MGVYTNHMADTRPLDCVQFFFLSTIDALTVAGHVNSPVALSDRNSVSAEIQLHLRHSAMRPSLSFDQLLQALYEHQPAKQ